MLQVTVLKHLQLSATRIIVLTKDIAQSLWLQFEILSGYKHTSLLTSFIKKKVLISSGKSVFNKIYYILSFRTKLKVLLFVVMKLRKTDQKATMFVFSLFSTCTTAPISTQDLLTIGLLHVSHLPEEVQLHLYHCECLQFSVNYSCEYNLFP